MLKDSPVVWVDTETTGLNPLVAEIIEFAGIKIEGNKEVDRLELKIHPQWIDSPPENAKWIVSNFNEDTWREGVQGALKVNGYTPEKWEGAYEHEEGIRRIAEFMRGASAVGGHNVSFDIAFIEAKVRALGLTGSRGRPLHLPYHKIDTVALAYEHLVPLGLDKVNLSKPGGVCDFLGISTEGAHTAMADIEMTLEVWRRLARSTWWNRLWWRFIGPRRVARL